MSVDEALKAAADQMTASLNNIKGAYDNEVSMMEDPEEEPEEEAGEGEETPKAKKDKKSKKAKKEEPEEEEDDSDEEEDSEDDEDEDDGEDYTDWSTKDLKKECRTRGIKVTKGMGKAEMVKALEADDKE